MEQISFAIDGRVQGLAPLLGPLLGPPMAAMGLQLFQHAKVTLIPKHDSWLMVWNMFSWLIYG